jgi:triphosphatase
VRAQIPVKIVMAPRAEPIHLNPATTLGCAVSSTVHECVIHIVRSADYARKSDDPEGIHQLRVSIRRLRAALSIFRLLEPGRRRPAVASKLRALQQELSAARDWDVLIEETIGSVRQRLRDWQGLNRLIKGAEAKRAKAYQLAQAALRDTRYTDLLLELESRIDGYFGLSMSRSRKAARKIALTSPAASFAVDVLRSRHTKVRRLGKKLRKLSPQSSTSCASVSRSCAMPWNSSATYGLGGEQDATCQG